MSLRDDLIAAKALIDTPAKWMKGYWGSDGCFCALGAAVEVAGADYHTGWGRLDEALGQALPPDFHVPAGVRSVSTFNDLETTTHADVMALFDRAIAATPSIDMSKQGAKQ